MRFEVRINSPGDKRVKSRFLFFPKIINEEFRWLEIATWEEQWQRGAGTMGVGYHWVALRWRLRG